MVIPDEQPIHHGSVSASPASISPASRGASSRDLAASGAAVGRGGGGGAQWRALPPQARPAWSRRRQPVRSRSPPARAGAEQAAGEPGQRKQHNISAQTTPSVWARLWFSPLFSLAGSGAGYKPPDPGQRYSRPDQSTRPMTRNWSAQSPRRSRLNGG